MKKDTNNVYILLIGPPGVGKTIVMNEVQKMLKEKGIELERYDRPVTLKVPSETKQYDHLYKFTEPKQILEKLTYLMFTDINDLAEAVHDNAKEHGFHPEDEPIEWWLSNMCNNLTGEVSELWESQRAGTLNEVCDKAAKMVELGLSPLTQVEEELADVIIRAMDMSKRLGIDIVSALNIKHEYNKTRPFKHGKKN